MIVKYSNMIDNSGMSAYQINDKIFVAQQHYDAFHVLEVFLNNNTPDKILEIGTAIGGLTSFINFIVRKKNPNLEFISLEINPNSVYDIIKNEGVDIRIKNIFDWNSLSIIDRDIIDFLTSPGKKIIFCDGGDKIKEFIILSEYLNSGDFILAHDYIDTESNFIENYKNKIWNWHEVSDAFIESTCLKYGLIDYEKDVFNKVVWVCKQKI